MRNKKASPDTFNFYKVLPVMTKSLTLAELLHASSNSETHHYQHNVHKMKIVSKTWVLTRKESGNFRRKKTSSINQTTP